MQYDVIVIGAGPGGTAAATFLAKKGVRVLLLDRATFPREKICGDGLTPRGVAAIEHLGALKQVTAAGQRINYAKVIAPNGRSASSLIQDLGHDDTYMLAIPRIDLDHILVQNAVNEGVVLQEACKVDSIENSDDHVTVKGETVGKAAVFTAKYAIIATGANMGLLKKQGFLDEAQQPIIAARAYFENAHHDKEHFNFHLNEVTLPGYGWVFPLQNNRVNIGVGIIPKKQKEQNNIKAHFDSFINRPYMKQVLSEATQLDDVKSYPIRTDFLTTLIYKQRTLLVGEAMGLVNPLTGEGIDYAIESGEIASEHLYHILHNGDQPADLCHYEKALKDKFSPIFKFSNQMVNCCMKPFMLNTMISVAAKRESLKNNLTSIILGLKEPPAKITTGKILMKIIKNLRNN